jgi:PEP-CTERM motif-containing protein
MKSAALLLAAVLTLTLAQSVARAQTEPELSIFTATPSVSPGQSFVVDVKISGVSDLYGWQLDLGFTSGLVSAGTATEGPFLAKGGSTFFIAGTNDNVGGSVSGNADTLLSAVPGVTGSGILEVFDFTATHSGSAAFSLQNVTLLDSGLNSISATLSGASVTVKGSTSVPEPSSLILLTLGLLCLAKPIFGRLRWSIRMA